MTERTDSQGMPRNSDSRPSSSEPVNAHPRRTVRPEPRALDAMRLYAASQTSAERRNILSSVLADGYGADEIVDVYVPAIARELGAKWVDDQMPFAEVTVGTSRLHSCIRELSSNWSGDTGADPDQPMILMACGQATHHSLGAVVVASQLRRRGVSVRLVLEADPDRIAFEIDRHRFGGMFLSAAVCDRLEPIAKIVESAKGCGAKDMPIVLGGTVLEKRVDVARATGADFATNDLDEALALCGLKIQRRRHAYFGARV